MKTPDGAPPGGAARTARAGALASLAGPLCAVIGTLGFSFKAILIKLAYAASSVDAITLLALRMLWSAPLFLAMAWWAGRGAPPVARADWIALGWLGFVGYYLASLLDFMGLAFITASLERLILFLYPTMVVLISAVWLRKPITRRIVGALALSYAGIVLAFWHDLAISGSAAATLVGGALVFGSALAYALYLVGAGGVIKRIGSMRFIALAMLVSTVFVLAHFALTRPLAALDAGSRVQGLAIAMAVFSTVIPTWLVAEAIRRIGADRTSLVGSLGPVFTIGLAALLLDEPVHAIQLAGAALVVAGVLLVSRPARPAAPAPD